jgi:ParB-like chromosome segregation protein Spo0J
MDKTNTEPSKLVPFNTIVDVAKVNILAGSMRLLGWQGLPLVAIERADGLFAVNGSHRIEAAMLAGIEVPVHVVDSDLLDYEWESLTDTDDVMDMFHDNEQVDAYHIMFVESMMERAYKS